MAEPGGGSIASPQNALIVELLRGNSWTFTRQRRVITFLPDGIGLAGSIIVHGDLPIYPITALSLACVDLELTRRPLKISGWHSLGSIR